MPDFLDDELADYEQMGEVEISATLLRDRNACSSIVFRISVAASTRGERYTWHLDQCEALTEDNAERFKSMARHAFDREVERLNGGPDVRS